MSLLRLIDANANRAREGLRVLEDIARFALDDAELSRACKEARHAVTGHVAAIADPLQAVAARDTPGDVGTSIVTVGEGSRESMAAIADAAAGRVGEALRVIEEAAKMSGMSDAASGVEAVRYRVYDVHKRIMLMLGPVQRRQFRLCVLLTSALCVHHPLLRVAEQALAGGADCLQLREKSMNDRDLLVLASRVGAVAREHGAALFVNDRVDIALLSGAQGVHLGQEDLPVLRARQVCGSRLLIGVSTGSLADARQAVQDGADLCGVGPMFQTTTKHKPVLAGPGYLREYLADGLTSRVPHLAIGGVTLSNVGQLVDAGCRGIAVSSAVCGAAEPAEVSRSLRAALGG